SSSKASGACTNGKMGEQEEAKQEHQWAGMSREPLRPTGPYLEAEPRFLTIPSTLSPKGTSPPFILEERAFLCPPFQLSHALGSQRFLRSFLSHEDRESVLPM